MDLDTIALTYLLHRAHPPLAEISTLEMDRTQSVEEFIALAASFSSKHLKGVRLGEMKVYKPRIPINTFQQFTTLVSCLPPNISSIAYPLQNSSSIEKDLPEFHHYVIIEVSSSPSLSPLPTNPLSHLLSTNHLPSPPPSPHLTPKNLYTPETAMATVLAHPLFEELTDLPDGRRVPITLVRRAFGVFMDCVEGRAEHADEGVCGSGELDGVSAGCADESWEEERGNDVGQQEALLSASLSSTLRSQSQQSEQSKFTTVRRALESWLGTSFELSCRASDSYYSSSSRIVLTHPSSSIKVLSHSHLALNTLLRTSAPTLTPQHALHLHLSGPFLEISGVAWTSFSVLYEPLCAVPMGYGVGFARVLRALREFKREVEREEEGGGEGGRGLEVPYPIFRDELEREIGMKIDRERVERPFGGRLVFFAPTLPSPTSPTSPTPLSSPSSPTPHPHAEELTIKFTRSYSPQTHTYLSERGYAPELYVAKRIEGGWWIVVMRRLGVRRGWVALSLLTSSSEEGEGDDEVGDEEEDQIGEETKMEERELEGKMQKSWYQSLESHILTALNQMHEAGYVHGDLRPENLFVRARGGGVSPSPSPSPTSLSPSSLSCHSPSPSPSSTLSPTATGPATAAPKTEFSLLDFDWSGPLGKARYPWDVNSLGVDRPPSVRGGGVIGAEEDVWMVRRWFESL